MQAATASDRSRYGFRAAMNRSTRPVSSLLHKTFADFGARGIGLKMSENLPRDDLYQRGAFDENRCSRYNPRKK